MFAAVLALAVFAVPGTVKAEIFEVVSVNKVDDINADFSGAGTSVNKHLDFPESEKAWFSFTQTYYYQFTLDAPSYIRIKEFASLWYGYLSGKIKFYVSSSPAFVEGAVISEAADDDSANYRSLYEAGTYYIKVEIVFDSNQSYFKAGSRKITGVAVKGAKVTVKVGKKTYTATAKNGKFTIKLKSKLKKGTAIKVQASKSGYTASKTVTYKVKKVKK